MEKMLKKQPPAMGISKTVENSDLDIYEITCDCHYDGHKHTISIEKEDDLNLVSVTIYTKMTSYFWDKSKVKQVFDILFKGCVEVQSEILLTKQQAINYANALIESVEKMK